MDTYNSNRTQRAVKPMSPAIHHAKHISEGKRKKKKEEKKARAHHHCLYPPKIATNAIPCECAPSAHSRRHATRPSQHLSAHAAPPLRCATNTNRCSGFRVLRLLWAIVSAFLT